METFELSDNLPLYLCHGSKGSRALRREYQKVVVEIANAQLKKEQKKNNRVCHIIDGVQIKNKLQITFV